MSEKNFSKAVREKLQGFKIYTFERFGADVPDLYLVSRNCPPCWLELKVVESVNCKIPFRKGQPKWMDDHTEAGGRAFVLVRVGKSDAYLLHGVNVSKMKTLKLAEIIAGVPTDCWFVCRFWLPGVEGWDVLGQSLTHSLGRPSAKI